MSARKDLARARTRLRDAEDVYRRVKAKVERRSIDDAGGPKQLGSNESERERALLLALENEREYLDAREYFRRCQSDVDILQAQLDDQIDERRKLDRQSRDRLSAALEALALSGRGGLAAEIEEAAS